MTNDAAFKNEDDVIIQKKEMRSRIKKIVTLFCTEKKDGEVIVPGSDAVSASLASSANLINSDYFIKADTVLAYMPAPAEADCTEVIRAALDAGKTTAVPRVRPGTSEMDFYIFNKDKPLDEQLEIGAYALREPKKTLSVWTPEAPVKDSGNILVVVPGVAFTKDGKRLGHGKGFYDRYLARISSACAKEKYNAVGFCFSCQFVASIPTDKYDVPLSAVVSESGICECHCLPD